MASKYDVMRDCELANAERRVQKGHVDQDTFFRKVDGNLLMSGIYATNTSLLMHMILAYLERNDMPTIVLTSKRELLEQLRSFPRIKVSGGRCKNFHPMYGMNHQQISRLFRIAGDELGCSSIIDNTLLLMMAVLDIVERRYPVSLPSISALLRSGDDFIAELAVREGLPEHVADVIRGSYEGGIMLRRMTEYLQRTFEEVALEDSETYYNFHSVVSGEIPVMAFYQYSQNQRVMNAYLKEELHMVLAKQGGKKVRIIADEMVFTGEQDELLQFLIQMKRLGKIEWIVCSQNVAEMLWGKEYDFANSCLFRHASITAFEHLSEKVFGKHPFYYPSISVGTPATFFYSLKRDERWTRQQEERLRVRAVDICEKPGIFFGEPEKIAIQIRNHSDIFLVDLPEFMQTGKRLPGS